MSLPALHSPAGGWTTDDLDAMPESDVRYELTDGALTVAASPNRRHQMVEHLLMSRLLDTAPDGLEVNHSVEIRFSAQLTRVPDLVIVRADAKAAHWFAPDEVLVAVEIESPGSHVEDRVTKPAIYSRFGIEHYWRFEFDPLVVVTYRLSDGSGYEGTGRFAERLHIEEPWSIDVPLSALSTPWLR